MATSSLLGFGWVNASSYWQGRGGYVFPAGLDDLMHPVIDRGEVVTSSLLGLDDLMHPVIDRGEVATSSLLDLDDLMHLVIDRGEVATSSLLGLDDLMHPVIDRGDVVTSSLLGLGWLHASSYWQGRCGNVFPVEVRMTSCIPLLTGEMWLRLPC